MVNRISEEELNKIFSKNIGSTLLNNKYASVPEIMAETIYDIGRDQILEATGIIRSVRDQAKNILSGKEVCMGWTNIGFRVDNKLAHKLCKWAKDWDKFLSRKLAWYDRRKQLGLPVGTYNGR